MSFIRGNYTRQERIEQAKSATRQAFARLTARACPKRKPRPRGRGEASGFRVPGSVSREPRRDLSPKIEDPPEPGPGPGC